LLLPGSLALAGIALTLFSAADTLISSL